MKKLTKKFNIKNVLIRILCIHIKDYYENTILFN